MGFYNKVRKYMGVNAKNPVDFVRMGRPPTAADKAFNYGTIWVDTATKIAYLFATETAGAADWVILADTIASPITVGTGGTGRSTLTANATLVGNTVTAVKMVGPGTNGQLYVGATGAAPAWATPGSADSSIAWTVGVNTITAAIATATAAQKGGSTLATGAEAIAGTDADKIITAATLASKLGTQTLHGVLVGGATTGAVTALAVGGANSVLAGAAGADPAFTATPTLTTLNTTGAIVAGTTVTATLGAITATNGDVVFGTAGNKIMSTSVGAAAAAGANSFGTVTLVNGTETVATTAITANSIVFLTRQTIGATGAAAIGHLSRGTIVAGTSFVINALNPADATAVVATDKSVVGWFIVN